MPDERPSPTLPVTELVRHLYIRAVQTPVMQPGYSFLDASRVKDPPGDTIGSFHLVSANVSTLAECWHLVLNPARPITAEERFVMPVWLSRYRRKPVCVFTRGREINGLWACLATPDGVSFDLGHLQHITSNFVPTHHPQQANQATNTAEDIQ
uniref:Uncharacterized protein n=1 Tax=viral metagenome TaxID=1070528 RepID=A0A2V0RHZ9_9ZZZZ